MTKKNGFVTTLLSTFLLVAPAWAQLVTEAPPVVPGAKPVAVETIKIQAPALQG
jgi:hypothetical protein